MIGQLTQFGVGFYSAYLVLSASRSSQNTTTTSSTFGNQQPAAHSPPLITSTLLDPSLLERRSARVSRGEKDQRDRREAFRIHFVSIQLTVTKEVEKASCIFFQGRLFRTNMRSLGS